MMTVEEIQETYRGYNYRKRGNRIFVDKIVGGNNGGTVYSWYKKKSPDSKMISVCNPGYTIRSRNFVDMTKVKFPKK